MNNRRIYRRFLIPAAACLVLLSGCARHQTNSAPTEEPLPMAAEQPQTFEAFTEMFIEEQVLGDPVPEHFSKDFLEQANIRYRELLDMLSGFDTTAMSKDDLLIYKRIQEWLNTKLLTEGLELYVQPLTPEDGIQIQIPRMFSEYPIHSVDDVDSYLALMERMQPLYEEILKFEQEKAAAGLLTGGEPLDMIIQSLNHYMVRPDNLFLTNRFSEKLAEIPELTEEQKKEYEKKHRNALKEHFIPAYRTLADGLEQLKNQTAETGGLASMPLGHEYYSYLIASGSGNDHSVSELTKSIEQRMAEQLNTITALTEQYPELTAEIVGSRFAYQETSSCLEWLRTSTREDFPQIAGRTYETKPMRSPRLSLSPAARYVNQGKKHVLYVNQEAESMLVDMAGQGWPGLMYRSMYYEEQKINPLLILMADNSSASAWALYGKQYAFRDGNGLSPEMNQFFSSYIEAEEALYAMMDIHLNYDGWSRQQFDSYCASYGFTDKEVMDRLYCEILGNPGKKACEYIGYLSLISMREEVEEALGEDFSPIEFHSLLLNLGPVPYELMEPYFRAWMLTKKL